MIPSLLYEARTEMNREMGQISCLYCKPEYRKGFLIDYSCDPFDRFLDISLRYVEELKVCFNKEWPSLFKFPPPHVNTLSDKVQTHSPKG